MHTQRSVAQLIQLRQWLGELIQNTHLSSGKVSTVAELTRSASAITPASRLSSTHSSLTTFFPPSRAATREAAGREPRSPRRRPPLLLLPPLPPPGGAAGQSPTGKGGGGTFFFPPHEIHGWRGSAARLGALAYGRG